MFLPLAFVFAIQLAGPAPETCTRSAECEEMALAAAGQGDYERFHDLIWRAIQAGPKQNPRLMFQLARAQSLSGRPLDALVTLRRLAERGVAVEDTKTSEDFRRVRALPDWPALAALLDALPATSGPAIAPATTNERSVPPSATREVSSIRGTGTHLYTRGVTPTALAYDVVSRRFVIAEAHTRTLKVVDERSERIVDFVGSGWTERYRTRAIDIDVRQGILWAVGSLEDDADAGREAAVHKLQLVSGRLLATVALPKTAGAAAFSDVAATSDGTVVVLDSLGGRIFRLLPQARSLERVMKLDVADATSVAPAPASVIYVAHATGLLRVDIARVSTSNVQSERGTSLNGLQRIRWYSGELYGIQETPDGNLAAVRIRLDAGGRRALSLSVLDRAASHAATIMNDAFYYARREPDGAGTTLRGVPLKR